VASSDHKDFLWCPRMPARPRQFEFTPRLITAAHVKTMLRRIPGFGIVLTRRIAQQTQHRENRVAPYMTTKSLSARGQPPASS
jgi:hypothetical protein